MKILSCITDPLEIPYIIRAGANEVYFAVSWIANYANSGSLKDFYQLKNAIAVCKKNSIKFHLAINDFRTPQSKEEYKLVKKTLDFGIDSVIVTDISFAKYLVSSFPEIEIHISSLFSVMNVKTLEFLYKHLRRKFKRLIIPNHISSYEAKPLIDWCKAKKINTEVFFFRYFGCTYLNGYCYLHGDRYFNRDFSKEGGICKFGCGGFKTKVIPIGETNKENISIVNERLNYGKVPRILDASCFFDYYVYGVDYVKYGTRTDPIKVKLGKISFIRNTLLKLEELTNKYGVDEAKKIFLKIMSKI